MRTETRGRTRTRTHATHTAAHTFQKEGGARFTLSTQHTTEHKNTDPRGPSLSYPILSYPTVWPYPTLPYLRLA